MSMASLLRSALAQPRSIWGRLTYGLGRLSTQTGTDVGYERKLYEERKNESLEQKRARLLYQSRKRGTLENDLLLASFAHKHLPTMNAEELDKYDYLINTISNEWDIYYWAVGVKEVPEEYRNSIMTKFIEHVKNENREQRFRQPEL